VSGAAFIASPLPIVNGLKLLNQFHQTLRASHVPVWVGLIKKDLIFGRVKPDGLKIVKEIDG